MFPNIRFAMLVKFIMRFYYFIPPFLAFACIVVCFVFVFCLLLMFGSLFPLLADRLAPPPNFPFVMNACPSVCAS